MDIPRYSPAGSRNAPLLEDPTAGEWVPLHFVQDICSRMVTAEKELETLRAAVKPAKPEKEEPEAKAKPIKPEPVKKK